MLKKIVGGGYLTSSSPFIITLFQQEDESIGSNISFDDAKELMKTTPIQFAEMLRRTEKTIIINTCQVFPLDVADKDQFADIIIIPFYCSNPYVLCPEFEPKDIGECFFIKASNSAKTQFQVWTRDGLKQIGISE